MSHRDLSLVEQEHVRVCLRLLRARFGNWRNVERSLPVAHSVLVDMMSGRCEVSVTIAFRAAKVLDASIYNVIAGTAVPPDICRLCGKELSEHWRCAGEAI
jgi:hypothetical protein